MPATVRPAALRLTVAALLAAASAAPALGADAIAPSKVSRVTVYQDRALVERTAVVPVAAGTTRIVLPGLPSGFDPASLRARSTQVQVLGVDTERVHLAREALAEADEARRAWEAAKRELTAASLDVEDARDAWERLKSVRAAALQRAGGALAGQEAASQSIGDALDLVDERGRVARRRILETEAARDAAAATEDAARRRYEQFTASANREETRAVVTVTAAADVQASLSVQYIVGNAGWTPLYDLRVSDDFGATSLEMGAHVAQATGEDWTGVPLELTTAQPSVGAAPPEPAPWIVDLYGPQDRGAAAPAAPAMEMERAADFDASPKATRVAEGLLVPVRRSGVVVAFSTALPATVPSGGQPARAAIGRFDLEGAVRWTAFPRATDKVFVTTKVRNTAGTALPAGEVRVFVGPDYVGPMQLADWGQDREIDVGLGVDREVEVARELLSDERSTSGLFSKDTVVDRSFRVTLRNHRDRAIDVRLLDQVPVSRDEDLVVEVTENSLALATLPAREAEDNKARGVLEWRFPMRAKGEFDLRFAFRVSYPQGKSIVGFED